MHGSNISLWSLVENKSQIQEQAAFVASKYSYFSHNYNFDVLIVKTQTRSQLNFTKHNLKLGWTRKWLCTPPHPPPHPSPHQRNSMSAISQLLLTRLWWNFKCRFLGTSRIDIEPNIEPQYWTQYWTQYWNQYWTPLAPILNPILNPEFNPNIEPNI